MDGKKVTLPITAEQVAALNEGDAVLLSGVIYSARDAAHKRLVELIKKGESLPIPIEGQTLYYLGPSPARPGRAAGSAGPTTSSRMDPYTPLLLEKGMKAMIGKGKRSDEVIKAIHDHHAVYFGSVGGAGAYLSSCITKMDCVAFEDLGPEAIYRLEVKDFPAFVVIK